MIPDLVQRAATTPKNKSVWVFKKLMFADLIGDAAVVFISYACALWYVAWKLGAGSVMDVFNKTEYSFLHLYTKRFPEYFILFFLFRAVMMWLMGRVSQRKKFEPFYELYASLICSVMMMICVWFLGWAEKSFWHMRGFFMTIAVSSIPVSFFMTAATDAFTKFMYKHKFLKKVDALLIGDGKIADIAEAFSKSRKLGAYNIIRRVATPPKGVDARRFLETQFEETPGIDAVFIFGQNMNSETIMEFVVESALAGKYSKAALPLRVNRDFVRQDSIGDAFITHFDCPHGTSFVDLPRDIFSRVLAALSMIPLLPLHIVLAALIRNGSTGDALFKQNRFGAFGAKFTMFKYRTMKHDAEEKRPELEHLNENDGGLFKIKSDPRITKEGGWLRKSSLDELPQVINILRGEMLFVGPRPLPCRDMDAYENRWQSARFFSKPGITGVWQTSGRAHVKFDEMCELDIWYSLNRTLRLDLIVIWKTIKSVIFGVGAY